VTWAIAKPVTILFTPIPSASGHKAVIRTAGLPCFSISFVIVAPQRVPVPHVEVSIAPSTPCFLNSSAISLPNSLALSIGIAQPDVVYK